MFRLEDLVMERPGVADSTSEACFVENIPASGVGQVGARRAAAKEEGGPG